MSPFGLFIIALVATWCVGGATAVRLLNRHYQRQGEKFCDSHALAIAEVQACVFFLGPVGLLGVHLLTAKE